MINNKKSGEDIIKLADKAYKRLEKCDLCPRNCEVNRIKGELGFCKSDYRTKVSSIIPHHGEEPPISGTCGSGTVFFSNCTLKCDYCQNYKISHLGNGNYITEEMLAEEFLSLQNKGCHNINLVTPTHYVPQILKALGMAIDKGLKLPIVYNTGGYESVETLKLLDGVVDIYLPDIKYSENKHAKILSVCSDYVEKNRKALKEMYRQTGLLKTDSEGIAMQGMIIRHLVLPNDLAGSDKSLEWISKELGNEVTISLMSQYMPINKDCKYKEIKRRITQSEYSGAVDSLHKYELLNGWTQDWEEINEDYIVDF